MNKLIKKIDAILNALDVKDVEGHIWWVKFRDFVIEYDINEGENLFNENYTDHPDYLISQDFLYNRSL